MSHAPLLIEIGTEELPPKALETLAQAFTQGIVDGLAERQLTHGEVQTYATPRRLALRIEQLQQQAPDQKIEALGPPADRAREADGSWSKAALGFARKNQVEPDQLDVAETSKGPRLVYRNTESGQRSEDALPAIIEEAVRKLPIPKRMRWGAGRTEFVRPVHWVLVLLGTQIVDCEILGCKAGRSSQGHRFHSSSEVIIKHPDDYVERLREAYVVASFSERRETIRSQVKAQAQAVNAVAVIDEDLLNEVSALVEWPVALTGSFEERFLQVPAEALVSSMKKHQKYFHVTNTEGGLLPHFITISNIESSDPAQVIDGNERVIRPRLSDADFFFRTDQKTTLASRVEALDKIVFQQQLGSLGDKTRRMALLAAALAPALGADATLAARAALLSKTDLMTDMVGEFPDMQGIAGRYYALHDGEDPQVARALEQQYQPRFSGDTLPDNPVASCLALADRLDTLVGIFGIGQAPTGSRDPFALRRASLGVLRILVEGEISLDLTDCLQWAADQYPTETLAEDTVNQVCQYLLDRFRAWYEDENIAVEIFKAVSAKGLSQPVDIHRRVHAVAAFSKLPQAAALAAANKRVSNILEKQGFSDSQSEVGKDLLTEPAEKTLGAEIERLKPLINQLLADHDYEQALASLASLQQAVDNFFEDVMVMAEDPQVRTNRLALLCSLRALFLQVADISLLAPGK